MRNEKGKKKVMIKASIFISAVQCQIPSLEGQHAAVNVVRGWFCNLSAILATKYGVLGWVLRSKELAFTTDKMRVSFHKQLQAATEFHPPHHQPTPPHLSSGKATSHLSEASKSQHPCSVVTLQGGYLARWSYVEGRTNSLRLLFSSIFLCVLRVSPLRSLRLKHALLLTYLLFHISYSATAQQSAYTGGSGDGHAMGELQLRPVAINELSNQEGYLIYPSIAKSGENIYLTSPVAGEFTLVDLAGRIIHTQSFDGAVQQLPISVTYKGLCIGILCTAEGTFTQKIVVVE